MERDQAAATGCDHSSFAQHGLLSLMEREGHPARAFGRLMADSLATLGIQGSVGFFGELSSGFAFEMLEHAKRCSPGLEVDRAHPDVLTLARATKGADEIAQIRKASAGTAAAMNRLREHLSSSATAPRP
jgi:Xaa-Pro aminopeptidase